MTYLDFEKEYIKDRPTEPYSENEDASDWQISLVMLKIIYRKHIILDMMNVIIFLWI